MKNRWETPWIPASALQLTVLPISHIHSNLYFEWKSHSPREFPVELYFTDNAKLVQDHWKKQKEWKLGQHYAISSPPCQFATLPFTEITPRAALCTLTEINCTAPCATLSHCIVSSEVAIPFEVRVHFNNDFSEAKTLPHDPYKKSYSFHSRVQTFLSSFSF